MAQTILFVHLPGDRGGRSDRACHKRRDGLPFYMVALIFAAGLRHARDLVWPYMIPFTITIADVAAPHSSLAFMFWGEGLFVFPLMLVYTAISYSAFRGKVWSASGNY